jgi:hypothetical protein
MKKILFGLLFLAGPAFAVTDVHEVGITCEAGSVSVSTTNPTAIPTTALSGRYRIDLINYDGTYDISIGTFSTFTFAKGFIITSTTTSAATSTINMRVPSGFAIYGLGASNTVRGTVNIRYLECK